MASKGVIPAVFIIGALAATPAWAGQEHRGRDRGQQRAQSSDQRQGGGDRAVQRDQGQRNQARANESQRQSPPQRYEVQPRRYEAPRAQVAPRADVNRGYNRAVPRQYDRRDYDRRDYRAAQPYYGSPRYGSRYGYGGHGYIAPRIIRPSIVTVVPYRPYVYRPSWSIGVYYGYNNYYPYGYTPRGYYDPIPGTPYGGIRITGVPRDAQVFADGYFVGIVDDFDGIFQHLNLEAGGHHIEIQLPGSYNPPLAFDVMVRPGETITYRAGY